MATIAFMPIELTNSIISSYTVVIKCMWPIDQNGIARFWLIQTTVYLTIPLATL
jgi:hypothetical protein